ncbi:MAG: hypothetical protein AB1758_33125 [Candidatus Eremiobacterota bacterium]
MRRRAGCKALTFAEVLVALAILAMAVMALISVQLFALQAGTKGRLRHQAATEAASRLDALEGLLRSSREEFQVDHSQARAAIPGRPGWFAAQADRLESPNLKRITVSVYFPDRTEHEYTLWTLVYRRP